MKKSIFSILLLLIALPCSAGQIKIDLEKIIKIESAGRENAYNKHSGARGLCQITPICLRDYNNHHARKYTRQQLFIGAINKKIARWYLERRIPTLLKYFHHPDTIRNRLIAYNAGIGRVGKRLPAETKNYIEKYLRENKKGGKK